jgi:putative DNA methylase
MTDHLVKRRKKLIEVAIPLEAINAASAREKSIRHGHPSTLHLWWARRPLAAARAVIFCQMVDDPSAVPEEFPTEEAQENERLRLFALISELVTWENTTNEQVLNRAREEIRRSWRRCCSDNADHPEAGELFNPEKLPGFHDPFAGGGALPLEAQRLGLEAYASDLNPVAVLINKAMIEIPPKFAGMPPVNPEARSKKQLIARQWKGAEGLAEDVRYYGKWMRDEAEKRIGHLYPKIRITPEMADSQENPRPDLAPLVGEELSVIAWLWARTVKSPDPAFADKWVPLISTYVLSNVKGQEYYIQPILRESDFSFSVRKGRLDKANPLAKGTKEGRGGNFRCILSGCSIPVAYIREQGRSNALGTRLIGIVAEGPRGRIYVDPVTEHALKAGQAVEPVDSPSQEINHNPRDIRTQLYGLDTYKDLFTTRQLSGLGELSGLIEEAREAAFNHAANKVCDSASGQSSINSEGYADAVATYLAIVVSRLADYNSSLSSWCVGGATTGTKMRNTFGRQAIPMTWDFAEVNLFSAQSGSFLNSLDYTAKAITCAGDQPGTACQQNAATQVLSGERIVSTDPPYYDNIAYADLSDYFYVWLRVALRRIYPGLFATLAVPKSEELVASPYRHGGKEKAEDFFLSGMTKALDQIATNASPSFPITIYYAFKQAETQGDEIASASTGWEAFLTAVLNSGLSISGTWPIRTERANRNVGLGANALASSVVLVCQRRDPSAAILSRNAFRRELRQRLPQVIKELEHANIAPVDVAQAAIGPGMAIFSQAKAVLNPDDSTMSVRDALIEINAALDEHLSEDEGSFDADTRFALTFFESHGYSERPYGDAEGLAVARNISVQGVASAGILSAIAGKVQLLRREQLDDDWDPSRDDRLCVWEATQHLIKALEAGGEAAAAALMVRLKQLPGQSDLLANCRALAYRLYNHCEKTKQAEEGRAYNGLVIAWQEIERQASNQPTETAVQASLI